MGRFYDLTFAELLQVWLHRVHLVDARASDGEACVLDYFDQLLAEAGHVAGQHPGAPVLLATLRALAQRVAAGERCTPPALKQEISAALYTALRLSTAPAVPWAPAAPLDFAPQAMAYADHA
ncbi:hypothetical protein [Hymenobacter nivis]|uniref:Uncharacterized protein n=1 Tax=Hymenobacter nivis TaxID=1850093 RepID=A0A502GWG7_9BACT|nr:hypothetical protein [Hymenobacter nivis]TPG65316.1 hypothetical protein EAH73_12580 [Hymenobacter nivis]